MKNALNKEGLTLLELIITILVMSIIIIAVTSVFAPMLNAYRRANNLAEANTLLDNIALIIISDLSNARDVSKNEAQFIITNISNVNVIYEVRPIEGRDVLWRIIDDVETLVFDVSFYGTTQIEIVWKPDYGSVTFELMLISDDNWVRERTYTVRPVGMQ